MGAKTRSFTNYNFLSETTNTSFTITHAISFLKITFESNSSSLLNNETEIIYHVRGGSLWAAEGHRPPAKLIGKMALMLPSCHFSSWQRLHLPPSHLQPRSQNINDFQPFYKAAFTLVSPLHPLSADTTDPLSEGPIDCKIKLLTS